MEKSPRNDHRSGGKLLIIGQFSGHHDDDHHPLFFADRGTTLGNGFNSREMREERDAEFLSHDLCGVLLSTSLCVICGCQASPKMLEIISGLHVATSCKGEERRQWESHVNNNFLSDKNLICRQKFLLFVTAPLPPPFCGPKKKPSQSRALFDGRSKR